MDYELPDELTDTARKHLFVSDLDGTLLNTSSRVPVGASRLISELAYRGALITVATARTPATVDRLLQHTFTRLPAIVMTGAAMWDRRHRRYLSPHLLGDEAAAKAISVCRSCDVNPFIYTLAADAVIHVYHNGAMSAKESKFVADRTGLPLKQFHLDEPVGLSATLPNVIFLLAMGALEDIYRLADKLRLMPELEVSAYPDNLQPQLGILEIFAAGVSKAAAIKALAKEIGAEKITVYGDNLNDIPMMRVADYAVAVENALPEVKAAATEVIGANTEEAVAQHILRTIRKYS